LRSSVNGPYLPRQSGRAVDIERTIEDTVAIVRMVVPDLMRGVRVLISTMPEQSTWMGMDRWRVIDGSSIVFYRVPIERLEHPDCGDRLHQRMAVERVVLEGLGELLGRDPWDLAPDSFRA